MRGPHPSGFRALPSLSATWTLLFAVLVPCAAIAQQTDDYLLGEERRLEMVVHVLGEVTRPGEYRVPDNTNVMELLSKAGGGTALAKMSAVTITRTGHSPYDVASTGLSGAQAPQEERVIHVDVEAYLQGKNGAALPALKPGDVVSVPRNGLSRWRTTSSILRDLSVVFTAYLLYVRTYEK